MAMSIASQGVTTIHFKQSQRLQHRLPFNPITHFRIAKQNHGSLQFGTTQKAQTYSKTKREFVVYNSILPGTPLPDPSGSPSNPWSGWLVGMVFTVVLPFLGHKWGPLLKWAKNIGAVVQRVEDVVDAIEEVAERVDKVAENISDKLPEGGKLRQAFDFIENVAEEIAKDAYTTSELIDKVQEVEDKVEAFLEDETEKTTETVKVVKTEVTETVEVVSDQKST